MMSDTAVRNITRILQNEITRGNNVVGVISVDATNHILLSWRTNSQDDAAKMQAALRKAINAGPSQDSLVHLAGEA